MTITKLDLSLIGFDGALVGINIGLAISSFVQGKTESGFFSLFMAFLLVLMTAWAVWLTHQRVRLNVLRARTEGRIQVLDVLDGTEDYDNIDAEHMAEFNSASRLFPWSKVS